MATILIGSGLLAVVALIVRSLWRARKKGGGCGCGCGHCPASSTCSSGEGNRSAP